MGGDSPWPSLRSRDITKRLWPGKAMDRRTCETPGLLGGETPTKLKKSLSSRTAARAEDVMAGGDRGEKGVTSLDLGNKRWHVNFFLPSP